MVQQSKKPTSMLAFKQVSWLSPTMQITIIILLYVFTVFLMMRQTQLHGATFPYPLLISVLLAPLYEEVLFRGWLLPALIARMERTKAIVITCTVSALWTLTNITQWETQHAINQMLLMGLVLSPVLCVLALKTKTIWPGVILHYLFNLLAGLSIWAIIALIIIV